MYYRIWCSALVVLAVVVWSWVANCVHCVKVTVRLSHSAHSLRQVQAMVRKFLPAYKRLNTYTLSLSHTHTHTHIYVYIYVYIYIQYIYIYITDLTLKSSAFCQKCVCYELHVIIRINSYYFTQQY